MDYPPLSQLFGLNLPSGDVWQKFGASFFSPQVNVTYAGNAAVEREVVSDVASFGKQLGILTDAVLALAAAADDRSAPIVTLRKLARDVARVKRRRRQATESGARDALTALGKADPEALRRLLTEFEARRQTP